ncbi:MAG: hypothetical protein HQ509_11235 [Candidatus Marinimicrobia bacterium]|nr:hypothetical protein [Candidatus Neomarinimicrobiota bacterium]
MKLFRFIYMLSICAPHFLGAQFSPGALSKYHDFLEGTSNCTQCHELGNKALSNGCVDCHSPLKTRIESKTGFHADKDKNCGECHSDHNGLDFEMVYWPKDINDFDHSETGYKLSGKHLELKCNQCHADSLIVGDNIREWAKKYPDKPTLDRTFLGLNKTCNVCHSDIHKKEVSDDCESCHNTSDWKRVVKEFDHNKAKYTLTGKHIEIECAKCHKPHTDWTPSVMQLTGLQYESCIPCHNDTHKEEVSDDCKSCHNTQDWKNVRESFDHTKAKYSLIGSHLNVSCEKCHKPYVEQVPPVLQLSGMKFDLCTSCHEDIHKGTFGQTCESCHTIQKWKENLKPFDHKKTKYPLEWKHSNILCNKCHDVKQGKLPEYDTCLKCHKDEHNGQFINRNDGGDCAYCHSVYGYKPTIFNVTKHNKARLPLDGAHLAVPCIFCHKPYESISGVTSTQFIWDDPKCETCHTDIHRNQFRPRYNNSCDNCHGPISFNKLVFDHQKSEFPLDGKHKKVSCNKCHENENDIAGQFTRYIPVQHRCQDCHTFTGQIR